MIKALLPGLLLCVLVYAGSRSWGSIPPVMDLLSPHAGIWQLKSPALDHQYRFNGLSAPVDIVLDERQVPHFFGDNYADVAQSLGYMHAKDRLFQMDVTSRFTLGQLAPLLGSDLGGIDSLSRRRGLPTSCERQADHWKTLTRTNTILQAYARGVNAYIETLDHRSLPVEYRLLNKAPGTWSPLHSAAIFKSMTFDLSFRNKDDISAATKKAFGDELYDLLYPSRYEEDRPIIPKNTSWDYIEGGPQAEGDDFGIDLEPGAPQEGLPPDGIGSNNWAVAGSRTASGHPILCNDPHLTLRLPAIWYEAQLHTGDANVYGVTIPGIPAVVIGFNEQIAWGLTNWGGDVLDWFKIDWVDRSKLTYRLDGQVEQGQWVTFETEIDGRPFADSVAWTYWGPVTYYHDREHRMKDHAMKWLGHMVHDSDELATFIDLASAYDKEEVITAIQQFRSPTQNIAFATQSGDIGLRISGSFPIRASGSGAFPYPGDEKRFDWKGLVPQEHHPLVVNPERGYISSANQVSTDTTYPYAYHGYFSDWRGRILNAKLDTMDKVTVDDLKALQLDDQSLLAIEGMQLLEAHIDRSKCSDREREVLDGLIKWDHRFDAESIWPAYFHEWFVGFYYSCWDEMPQQEGLRMPDHRQTIILARDTPTLALFDHVDTEDHQETAIDLVHYAWEAAVAKIDSLRQGRKVYAWADYNQNRVQHLLRLDPFSSPVNRVSGYKYALNATNATHGPSWRMAVELSDPVKAWGIYPGGPSGHPGNPFYDVDILPWEQGAYHELHLYQDLAAAKAAASHHISCQP